MEVLTGLELSFIVHHSSGHLVVSGIYLHDGGPHHIIFGSLRDPVVSLIIVKLEVVSSIFLEV